MQVKSTAECSTGAFCNTFDLHSAIIGLENLFFFLSSFERPLKTGFTVYVYFSILTQMAYCYIGLAPMSSCLFDKSLHEEAHEI